MTFLRWRSILGHDHEAVGAQPMDKFVLLIPLVLPERNGRREPGVDHHLDQLAARLGAGQKFAQPQPIEPASRGPHGAADVGFIDQDEGEGR